MITKDRRLAYRYAGLEREVMGRAGYISSVAVVHPGAQAATLYGLAWGGFALPEGGHG